MAQFSRPSEDVFVGTFTDEGGATSALWQSIDEVTPSDTDYVESQDAPNFHSYTAALSAVADPGVSTGHVFRCRMGKNAAGGEEMHARLAELRNPDGSTIAAITQFDLSDMPATFTHNLTPTEVAAIQDYAAIWFQVFADGGGGTARALRVHWVEFEAPDVGGAISFGAPSTFLALTMPDNRLTVAMTSAALSLAHADNRLTVRLED